MPAMTPPREPCWRNRVLLVLAVSLVARVAFVLCYPQAPVVNDALAYDQEGYFFAFGKDLHWPNTTITKAPMYSMFLAGIYRLLGHDYTVVRLVQAVVGTLAVWLVFLVGREVFGRRVAWLAAWLAAGYPPFIAYTGWLLSENLTTILVLAFVYSAVLAVQQPTGWSWMRTGLITGILALTREEFLALIVLTAAAAWWWRVSARRVAAFVAVTALVILPWTIRNWRVYGKFALISPYVGQGLWISSYPADWMTWNADDPYYQQLVGGLSHLEADEALRQDAVRRIRREPLTYLRLCVKRLPRLWIGGHSNMVVHLEQGLLAYLEQGDYAKVAIKLAMLAVNMGITALGFAGLWLVFTRGIADRRLAMLLALPIAVKAVIHVFLYAVLRFQIPIMSFLILFAAVEICHVRRPVAALGPVPAHA